MSMPFSNRDLLYGILAVQQGFVDREQLVQSIQDRTRDRPLPLGEILLERRFLTQQSKESLDSLVEEHLAQHGNDSEKSLATLSAVGSLGDELRTLGIPDLNATLAHWPETVTQTVAKTSRANKRVSGTNRFRILRKHAKGGMGQVSVAIDDELSREVALKELQTRYADDQSTRARFVLEAEITGGLEHPGVVPVYGLGHYADGRPFYAMRFVRGDSLQDATQRFHERFASDPTDGSYDLELRKLLRRFVDVCNAIEYAHSRGVLHRDLKPGNIMLGRYGETLVVDWGLAKVGTETTTPADAEKEPTLHPASAEDSAPTQLGSTVGTPQYMSPEQAAGKIEELGTVSDVYSLGATLYHVLTGSPPFQGSDIGVILSAVQTGIMRRPRVVNRRIAKPLEAICLKAMALQPDDRYRTPQALAEDIESWLADEPVEAMPDSGLQRIQRWTRRHRGVTVATAVGLLLVSAISALAYLAVSAKRDEAHKQRDRAMTSEAEALKSFQAAETARATAVEQEQLAARVAYNSTLSEASGILGSDPMMAKLLLEDEVRCTPRERDFLWHCLMRQVVREEHTIALENPRTHAMDYSPDGNVIATGGEDSGEVLLWDTKTGKQIANLETKLDSVHQVLFAPDGKSLAVAYWETLEIAGQSSETLAKVQIWDLRARKKLLSRELQLPQNNQLAASDKGFFLHSFVTELEYANSHPEYEQRYQQVANENGKIIDRWHQWRIYNVQSEQETVKFLSIGEGTDIAEGFSVHGHWLTSPCHTSAGEFLWMVDLRNQIAKLTKVGPPVSNKSSLLIRTNDNAAYFLGMKYVDESVSEIDSLAYLDTIEFDTDISFQELAFEGSEVQPSDAVGRLHSGLFVEDERSQFVATDSQGSILATVLEHRPVIQVFDLNRPALIHIVPAHLGDIFSVAVSPNGRQLASLGLDRTLRLWDLEQLRAPREYVMPTVNRPRRLLLSPSGDQVVLLALGPDPSQSEIDFSQPLPAGETEYPTSAFFQMEKFQLSAAASLSTRDFQDPPQRKPTSGKGVLGVFGSFSEGIGDAVAGSFLANPVQNELTEAKLSPAGKQLILAGPARLLRYNLETGHAEELWGEYYPDLKKPAEIMRIVLSDDLKLFATLQEKDRSIRVYDLNSQQLLWQLPAHRSQAFELKFVPGSHTLLVMREPSETDSSSLHSLCELVDVETRSVRAINLPEIETHYPLDFSEDGKLLVVFQQFNREVLVLNLETGEIVSQVNVVRETPAGMLPQSELLMLLGESGELKLWDTRLNQYRATLHIFDGEAVSKAVLSHDRNTLVVLGEEGSLRFLGADRLRDDLADIRALLQVTPQLPDEADTAAVDTLADGSAAVPQIEILDDLPVLPERQRQPIENEADLPLPPAPIPLDF